MTTTPDAPPSPPGGPGPDHGPDRGPDDGPRVTRDQVRDLGRLRRTIGSDRKVAGVAGGLARHLDIDPVILRVAFVVLAFFGGSGLLLYGACWLLVPEDGRDRGAIGLDDQSRGLALVGVDVLAALVLLGDSVWHFNFPWPLIVIALLALAVLAFVDRRRDRPRVTAPPVPHHYDPATGRAVPTSSPIGQPPAPAPMASTPQARPRRRGPILFWFTMALAAVAVGVLGVADLAGASVLPSAYPAAVVATCGLMLVVGAFYGRGGGLILVGLVASLAMLVASVVGPWHGSGDLQPTPTAAAAVHDEYRLSAGEIVLDLSQVADPAALDGRTLHVASRFGRVEVVVPRGLDAVVNADVTGAGHIIVFGKTWDGPGVSGSLHHTVPGAPSVTIDATVLFGEIDVRSEAVR